MTMKSHHSYSIISQKERNKILRKAGLFFLWSLFVGTIIFWFFFYSPNPSPFIDESIQRVDERSQSNKSKTGTNSRPFIDVSKQVDAGSPLIKSKQETEEGIPPIKSQTGIDESKQQVNEGSPPIKPTTDEKPCNLFEGRWIWNPKGSLYTNTTCSTIPESKNCRKYGREDNDFVKWRWKPNECELPSFDPKTFLEIVRGKKLAFIGDSVARNQMESLLCLLSQVETPIDVFKDADDRFRTWHFPSHDFTLMVLWSKFLVVATEREINGSSSGVFDIQLDKIETGWLEKLPELDYSILSDGHWFFRKSYLYEGDKLIGCVFCEDANVTNLGLVYALRRTFQTALNHINRCEECRGMVTLLRTFSPAHFEHGTWNDGGTCNRTMPFRESEVKLGGTEWEIKKVQVEEVERIKVEGEKNGKRFEVLDVTKAMLMRPDGHPGSYWNKWADGYNDCVHWCLPGPIDVWNDLLLGVLKKDS